MTGLKPKWNGLILILGFLGLFFSSLEEHPRFAQSERTAGRHRILELLFLPHAQAQAPAEPPSESQEPPTLFSLFDKKEYAQALKLLEANPPTTAHDHYNLGTLYLKLNQPGKAVAHLKKALHLHPRDPDVKQNLKLAKEALLSQLGNPTSLEPAVGPLGLLQNFLQTDELQWILRCSSVAFLMLWLGTYLKHRSLRKTLRTPWGLTAFVGLGICFLGWSAQRLPIGTNPAVCLESEPIRSGPGLHYSILGKLESGIEVELLVFTSDEPKNSSETPTQDSEAWQQVQYQSGGIGWVRAKSLLVL
ncbi:MAG: tetratricopeptide repeat protein [Bdellovibrionia bacterium]